MEDGRWVQDEECGIYLMQFCYTAWLNARFRLVNLDVPEDRQEVNTDGNTVWALAVSKHWLVEKKR